MKPIDRTVKNTCGFRLDSAAILKSYKENLVGLFFMLLVNYNPLHRTSGVAGLVAMVSSTLLLEQEVQYVVLTVHVHKLRCQHHDQLHAKIKRRTRIFRL